MRKSRKNKYYSQNQEGGWLWSRNSNKRVAPTPTPFYLLPLNPGTIRPFGVIPDSAYSQDEYDTRSSTQSYEKIINDTIFYTIKNIKFERQRIQALLQTEDKDVISELEARSPEDYNYYTDGDNPRTSNNIQDKQKYVDSLKEEYKKTQDYSTVVKEFAEEYRKAKVKTYIEPYTQYMDDILSYKADITNIRNKIKKLLQDNKQQLKGTNFDLFRRYRLNYAGELPRTEPHDIFNKESELTKLKEEFSDAQKDLEELETLIYSSILPPK